MAHPPSEPVPSSSAPPNIADTTTETIERSSSPENEDQAQLLVSANNDEVVEIDDRPDFDGDSALEEDDTPSTASLTSSVLNYTYENGRRYHSYHSGEYLLPNDDKEQERMDLKHHIFGLLLGGRLFLAPITANPQRILDVGTGTGIWVIEVADAYPSAEVIGVDLSPIQPRWIPPNVSFVVDDVEFPWLYKPSQAFDFIHFRMLLAGIKDWPRLYEQAYTHLKPGGWLEVQDHASMVESDDNSIEKAKDLVDWFKLVHEACTKFGKEADIAHKQKRWMIEAGFVDVQEDVYKVPIGRWPKDKFQKEIGLYFQVQTLDGLEPVSMALFTRVLGYSIEQVQAMLVSPRNVVRDPQCHLYVKFYIVRGRKPLPR